jgi:hypothetical protein
MAELRIPPHIRDLILDHAPARGSGAGYDHYTCTATRCGRRWKRGPVT